MSTLIAIDGNSLMHRAFYALPAMKSPAGEPTGALYGFVNMLSLLVEQYAPTHLVVAFDEKGGTFRHRVYGEYKAGRRATPDDLAAQLGRVRGVLRAMGVATVGMEGFEADDMLGSLAAAGEAAGMRVYIVTGDRDALQLISGSTSVIMTKKGVSDTTVYDEAALREAYGLGPAQIVDLKALMGDSSDNIPGVPGVGEKTALKLLTEYGTLDGVYESIDRLPKNKLRERLIENEELARLSFSLATIKRDIPVDAAGCAFSGFEPAGTREALSELGFGSVLNRLGLSDGMQEDSVEVMPMNEKAFSRLMSAEHIAVLPDKDNVFFAVGEEEWCVPASDPRAAELLRGPAEKTVFDAKLLMHLAPEMPAPAFDCELAAYVLDPSRKSYAVDSLRTAEDRGRAAALFTIRERQQRQIDGAELGGIYYDIEAPLTRVLWEMESRGFRVDREALKALSEGYAERARILAEEIYESTGERFNIASPKQLGHVLFDVLGLPSGKKTKTGWSTDAATLERLADVHPAIGKVLEYRSVTKLDSTYAKGLSAIADGDGFIHTNFRQTVTATGRISSTEPNLQNIPVRTDEGREIRRCFLPCSEDNILVSADYSQIELRVLAHISGDERMLAAFRNEEDIHTRTASQVFGVPMELVSREMRSRAKAVNFGIVYGISDFGLARNLDIPIYEAADYIKSYLEKFSAVRDYMRDIVARAKEEGFVRTLFGRIRYIPELKASNRNVRGFGERVAMNTPIQGTAADIIKLAMIAVSRELAKGGFEAKLILQVHDELIIDCPKHEAETVAQLVKREMENAVELDVPLVADVGFGENWAAAK